MFDVILFDNNNKNKTIVSAQLNILIDDCYEKVYFVYFDLKLQEQRLLIVWNLFIGT